MISKIHVNKECHAVHNHRLCRNQRLTRGSVGTEDQRVQLMLHDLKENAAIFKSSHIVAL